MHPKLQGQIKQCIKEYEEVLKQLAEMQKNQWRSHSPKADTADETMYRLGQLEGKCQGLDEFLQELERIAGSYD